MEQTVICSKCEKNPADKGQRWCRTCRSAHELERQATKSEIEQAKSFQEGANAMRKTLAQQLARGPGYMMEASEVAKWIMEYPAPPAKT